ncbi:MAG TPA: DUF4294 domain-containing protein [Draconibacterium sp.]|nr:DUF4294 domain-containing protein [Draconibacterium sp.]
MKRLIYIVVFLCVPVFTVFAQKKDTTQILMGIVQGGDTIIHKNIKEVVVVPNRHFESRRMQRRYNRYVQKVKKVYPLAVEAKELLKKYEPVYNKLEDKRDKRKLMKRLEKELLAKHKEELKKWSISDGRILLKLINRETDRTPYSIIKDFRGDFSAFFWQSIAKLFSNDLKAGYNPEGDDQWLEEIVTLIELGYI